MSKSAIPRACYESLMSSKVLRGRHHFETPDFSRKPLQRNARIPDEAFQGQLDKLEASNGKKLKREVDPRKMISYGEATWYSPGPSNLNTPYCDLEMMQGLAKTEQRHLTKSAWLSCFLDAPNLLVKRVGAHPSSWFFAIGGNDNTASIVWPAEEMKLKGEKRRAFRPSTKETSVSWAIVVRLEDWVALPYTWRSPLWQVRHMPKNFGGRDAALWAIAESDEKPLLNVGAEAAFWTLSMHKCKSLADHLGLAVPQGSTLLDVLSLLIRTVLGITEEKALDIVGTRLDRMDPKSASTYSELLECNEALFHMPKDDEKAVRKDQDDLKKAETKSQSLEKEWKEKVLHAKGYKAALPKAEKKKILKAVRIGIHRFPDGDITPEQANAMLPPGGQIWREYRDGCWRGKLSDGPRVSKATLSGGPRTACQFVLRALWLRWLERHLLSVADCPIEDLFSEVVVVEDVAPAGAAASSSGDVPAP
jgi:hypothetical protein